jgi:hypothetical protein
MERRSWIARLIYIAISLVFLLVLHAISFTTARANPIVISTYPDSFLINWPTDMERPKEFDLQCERIFGEPYKAHIVCSGPTCTGEDYVALYPFLNREGDAKSCDLQFTFDSLEYVIHYDNPLPVECAIEDVMSIEKIERIVVYEDGSTSQAESANIETKVGEQKVCSWNFDLTNKIRRKAVSAGGLRKQLPYDIPPAWSLFLKGLLLAWLVEIPVFLAMTRFLIHARKISIRRVILIGLITNLVTLPFLWYILPLFLGGILYVIVGELFVILIEAGILAFGLKINYSKALLMSFIANAASFALGLWLL